MAAAHAIAAQARGDELVPDPLDKELHEKVSRGSARGGGCASCASVRDAEAAVGRGQQPQRPDQQELQVLEEGRTPALDGVADELPDPRDDEDRQRGQPQRPGQVR